MKKRNINPDPPEHRPDPPPPPPKRGTPILAKVIEDLRMLDRLRNVPTKEARLSEFLNNLAMANGLTVEELLDRLKSKCPPTP
jgi:hypothetical protein